MVSSFSLYIWYLVCLLLDYFAYSWLSLFRVLESITYQWYSFLWNSYTLGYYSNCIVYPRGKEAKKTCSFLNEFLINLYQSRDAWIRYERVSEFKGIISFVEFLEQRMRLKMLIKWEKLWLMLYNLMYILMFSMLYGSKFQNQKLVHMWICISIKQLKTTIELLL